MRILYIDIDSLRADHLSCYGYHRKTSPNIDALAAESVRFNNLYCPDAPCLPSRTAFYSGRFGIQTGVVGHGGTAASPRNEGAGRGFRDLFDTAGLPGQLQKCGFHTAMCSPFGQRHAAHWFYAGFNEILNPGKGGMESAEEVWPMLGPWLERSAASDNWYLHVNLWDPHTPYRVPLAFGNPFAHDPLPQWLENPATLARHIAAVGPHTAQDISMYGDQENPKYPRQPGKITDAASLRRVIDGYDTGVLYADMYVGRIVDALKKAGVYDHTAIIISADHGENLGELGIYAEHATADQPTCRVPFLIRWPHIKPGVANALHYNLDVAPTLMDLLGGKPPAIWDGVSFAPTLRTGKDTGHDQLIVSQCCHVCQRSVRFGDYLYIRTYHDGFHLFPDEMLFDLASDPHEEHDLATARPEICRDGAHRLLRWHDQQMAKMPAPKTDPLWTVIQEGGPFHAQHAGPNSPLPKYLQRLEATNRAAGAAALRRKYAGFLPD